MRVGGLRRNEVRRATSLAPEHLQGRALAKTSEHVPEFHDLPATWTRARLEWVGALCRLRFVRRRRRRGQQVPVPLDQELLKALGELQATRQYAPVPC